MGTSHLNLKWENYMFNMVNYFQDFLSSEIFVDVTLACEGTKLGAHKIVLSACSPFLRSLFVENPCKHPIILISDISLENLKAILKYMYTGEVDVPHENVPSLLKASKSLSIVGLIEILKDYQAKGVYPPRKYPFGKKTKKRAYKESSSNSNSSDDNDSSNSFKKTSSKSPCDSQSILNLSFPCKNNTSTPENPRTSIPFLQTLLRSHPEESFKHLASAPSQTITEQPPNALNLTFQSRHDPEDSSLPEDQSQLGTDDPIKDPAPTTFAASLATAECLSLDIKQPNEDSNNSRVLQRPNSYQSDAHLDLSETSNDAFSCDETDVANRKQGGEKKVLASNENHSASGVNKHPEKTSLDKPKNEHVYKCNICNKTYPKQINLNWHYQRAHSTKEFRCDICNKSFKTRDLVTQHMRVHMPDSFTCKYCNLSFRWRSSLKKHTIKHHNQSSSHEQEMEP